MKSSFLGFSLPPTPEPFPTTRNKEELAQSFTARRILRGGWVGRTLAFGKRVCLTPDTPSELPLSLRPILRAILAPSTLYLSPRFLY